MLCIGLGTLFNSLILSVTGGVVWSFLAGVAAGASLEEGSAQTAGSESREQTRPSTAPLARAA